MNCKGCNQEINLFDPQCGYIKENDGIYCEKCYANKRFSEIIDKTKWKDQVVALIQEFNEPILDSIKDPVIRKQKKTMIQAMMRKIPNDWESLFKDQGYVKKIREGWKKMGWEV